MTRRLFTALALISAVACGSATEPPRTMTIAGQWNLRTVNGAPLPYKRGAEILESETFLISDVASGTFSEAWASHVPPSTSSSKETRAGTFKVYGEKVSLVRYGYDVTPLAWNGTFDGQNELTLKPNFGDLSSVYVFVRAQ